ncbi:MAG: hypothetical protein AAFP84_02945 [Actinomycetota bacterium]
MSTVASTIDATTTVPGPTEEADQSEPARRFEDGPLADVCPATIVVQIESLPSVEHGPLFSLLPAGPTIDEGGQRVSGPLRRPDGQVEDVTLELRAGGPAVSFRSPVALQADDEIHLAETSYVELASRTDLSATGVVGLTSAGHDMVMWDPETYPNIEDLDDIRTAGVEVRHVTGEPFIAFLAANGVLDAEQLVPDADGGPAAFVTADGAIARQGDSMLDSELFAVLPQWDRPVRFALASTRGWLDADDLLAVSGDGRLGEDCIGRLVPIIQRAIAFYVGQPGPTNELMAEVRRRFTPLDRVSANLLDAAAQSAIDTGVLGDTVDGVVGGIDLDRLSDFAPALGTALEQELRNVDEAVTTVFLDPDVR